jgi:hypothetical protein
MTTAAYKVGQATLQTGASDIVALVTLANSVRGWVGGLSGVRNVLQSVRSHWSSKSTELLKFDFPPSRAYYLTFDGTKLFQNEDSEEAFGGDPTTQWLGATLCVLAKECGNLTAIDLLVNVMIREYFPSLEGFVRDAIAQQLRDRVDAIVTEGATRGFPELFMDATEGLPQGDKQYLKKKLFAGRSDNHPQMEKDFVAGFLRWVAMEENDPYFTRSGAVLRVAACLRAVGYNFAPGMTWAGTEANPNPGRAAVLVTGGVESDISTDKFLFEPGRITPDTRPVYYRTSTVGALCVNSFHHLAELTNEECQSYYIRIRRLVQKSFTCSWGARSSRDAKTQMIFASFDSHDLQTCENPFALQLAAFYFPKSASLLAQFYHAIGDQSTLQSVKTNLEAVGDYDEIPVELQRFRVVTLCIVLSFAELLTQPEFEQQRHVATIELETEDCLSLLSQTLDDGINSGLSLWQSSVLVAAVHAGIDTEAAEMLRQRVNPGHRVALLGRRSGIFCVVPRLLTTMEPSRNALGLVCLDKFIGNLPTDENGWIYDGTPPLPNFRPLNDPDSVFEPSNDSIDIEQGRQDFHLDLRRSTGSVQTFIGQPQTNSPDVPLYLSIERPLHEPSPHLLLTGRVNGSAIGQVGVQNVMLAIARSTAIDSKLCPGHDSESPLRVLNMSASTWIEKKALSHSRWNIFLNVKGDRAWALFTAGQTQDIGGLIIFTCPHCSEKELNKEYAPTKPTLIDFRTE